MRRAAKVDATQDAIVKALRACGVAVEIIARPIDLMACTQDGTVHLLEVKNRDGKDRLTADQVSFIGRWPGMVHIVHTPDEALKAVLGERVMA